LRLLPHAGDWNPAGAVRAAYALQEPLLARPAAAQTGSVASFSLLRLEGDTSVLATAKLAEDGGALLVRGYEAAGHGGPLAIVSDRLGRRWAYTAAPHEI
jgi:alpha-mannosidase